MRDKGKGKRPGATGRRGLLASVLGAVLALGAMAAPAGAVDYSPTPFAEGDFFLATSLAVDQVDGDVYATDYIGTEVFKYDMSIVPPALTMLGEEAEAGEVRGVALDPASGNIYFTTKKDDYEITILAPNGSLLDSFEPTEQPHYGLASDSEGNVFVPVQDANSSVQKYSPAGVLLDTIDCAECPDTPTFGNSRSLALDAEDNLYIVDADNDRVLKFDSTGTFDSIFKSGEESKAIAIDIATGDIFLGNALDGGGLHVIGMDSTGTPFADFGGGLLTNAYAIGVGPGMGVNPVTGSVFVTDGGEAFGNNLLWEFVPTLPPEVITGSATGVSKTAATLEGTVDPQGRETTECLFEYGTTEDYGATAPCETMPGEENEAVAVSADISGLSAGTTYHYRLVAANTDGEAQGDDETFTTAAQPAPLVSTEAATGVSQTGATLNGKVDAEGDPADCTFEYGTTTAYGKTAACSVDPVTGTAQTVVSAAVSGLSANTTYHFRVVAENSGGEVQGNDLTFTTSAHTCETDASLCPPPPPPPSGDGGATPPPPITQTPAKKKPLKCKKGFKKKKVKAKAKCVKLKKKAKKKAKKKR